MSNIRVVEVQQVNKLPRLYAAYGAGPVEHAADEFARRFGRRPDVAYRWHNDTCFELTEREWAENMGLVGRVTRS